MVHADLLQNEEIIGELRKFLRRLQNPQID